MKRCASCTSAHGSRFAKTLSEPDTRAHRGERGFFSSLYVQVYGRARPRRTMMKSTYYFLAVVAAAGISFSSHRDTRFGERAAGHPYFKRDYLGRAIDGKIFVASAGGDRESYVKILGG